jgi:hypothetical protein
MVAALAVTAVAQDWYHDRDARYHGEEWRSHVFTNVRTDLEHIYSGAAADKGTHATGENPGGADQIAG